MLAMTTLFVASLPPAGAQPAAWPTTWTGLSADPDESGGSNHRDVFDTNGDGYALYYTADSQYLYLRMETVDLPGWPSTGPQGEARYKWWFDTGGTAAYLSGTTVNNAEFQLILEDRTDTSNNDRSRDRLGELTLMDDLQIVGFTSRWNQGNNGWYITNTPDNDGPSSLWKRALGSGTAGTGGPQGVMGSGIGYRIDDATTGGRFVDMYISWAALGNPSSLCLIWATDTHNPNLDQAPNLDRPEGTSCLPTCTPLNADFYANNTTRCVNQSVTFASNSTGSPTSWSWTFGDGGTSTAQNATHSYASAGNYTVTLNVSNSCFSDTETKTNYITVTPCTTYYKDADADTYGVTGDTQCLCAPTGNYTATRGGDCNDSNASVHPGATEVCNGIDDNCNGQVDEGVTTTYYQDNDGDGYGNPAVSTQACSQPQGYVLDNTDCNDNDASEHPGQTWYKDADNDLYSDGTNTISCTRPTGYKVASELTATSGDCNDTDAAVNPAATEICNGIDDDCDGLIDDADPGITSQSTWYADSDGDLYGDPNVSMLACYQPAGYVSDNTDCDDSNAAVNPAATEVCNGIDDNCNGQVDEGVTTTYYQDNDGDGYGNPAVSTQACSQPQGYVLDNTDCDDNDANEHPGQTWYKDADNDLYSDGTNTTSCTRPTGYKLASELTATSGDCDDTNASVNPAATEVCNGIDDNCNGQVDEGVTTTYYQDNDGDGYGNPSVSQQACSQPQGYVPDNTDCNDSNASVHPGATEVCNGIDDDCDGNVDEGLASTWYQDSDSDGYGNATASMQACSQPQGYVLDNTDCNDNDANEHPGQTWYKDADNDLYSDGTNTTSCTRPTGYKLASELTATSGDCDDSNASVHPGATEVCNGIDDNCNGQVDEGVTTTYYQDNDGDGYGNSAVSTQACSQPQGYVLDNTDCDDTNAAVNPGATEICGNGIDDNCNGQVDEGVQATYYQDNDGDGYGNPAVSQQACSQPQGYVLDNTDCNDNDANEHPGQTWYKDADNDLYSDGTNTTSCTRPTGYKLASELTATSGDCDDTNAAVNPGATEVCNDIDDNCDGNIDENCINRPSLNITKTVSTDPVGPGGTLTYTITVANTGSANATGVTVVDDYDETVLDITDAGGGIDDGDTITCDGGITIPVGDQISYTITATVSPTARRGSTFYNTANVTCIEGVSDSTIPIPTTVATRHYPSAGGCSPMRYLTVDWEGNNTTKPLYSNNKLALDLLGPSPDSSANLFLERGTHAPVVDERTYYLIVVRELEEIPPVPENYQAIVVLNITPTDAEFDRDILLTLRLNQTQLPANASNVTMAYYDDVKEAWVPLESTQGEQDGVLTISAPINHFSIFGVLAKLASTPPTPNSQPAHFAASGLSITSSVEKIWEPITFVTKIGEVVTISANVANDGGQEGTYDVVLKLNGQTVDTKTVTIGAGQSKLVIFTRSGLDYGEYDVDVAGLTDEFTVSRTITWWLIVLLIVAVALIIWGVLWGRKKRRKAQQGT